MGYDLYCYIGDNEKKNRLKYLSSTLQYIFGPAYIMNVRSLHVLLSPYNIFINEQQKVYQLKKKREKRVLEKTFTQNSF